MNSDVRLFGMDGMHEGCKKLPRVKKFTMVVAAFLSHTLVGAHSCFSFLLIPFRPLSKNLTRHFSTELTDFVCQTTRSTSIHVSHCR